MKKPMLFAAALIALSAGAVHAQDKPQGSAQRPVPRPDPFGDATISRADAQAKAEAQFAELDKDHDGFLSADEFAGMFPENSRMRIMAPMMIPRLDTNGDGKISKDEFVGLALKRFDMGDANHDGQLTKAERDTAREAMRAQARARRGGGGGFGGGPGGDGPPPQGGDGPPPPGGDGPPPPGGDGGQ